MPKDRQIPKLRVPPDADSETRLLYERANGFIERMNRVPVVEAPNESKAIRRVGGEKPFLESTTRLEPKIENGKLVFYNVGQGKKYGTHEYYEFPNSTMIQTSARNGKSRQFVLTRGVRRYHTVVDLKDGSIEPQGYVSDVLCFEIVNGEPVYRNTVLESSPESKFFFEDPRVSTLWSNPGEKPEYLLGGTDYSPHLKGSADPDAMNRYVKLAVDADGLPQPVKVDPTTKKPKFLDFGPMPQIGSDGKPLIVDGKNTVVGFNEQGHVVATLRARPPNHSDINQYFPKSWQYGQQVLEFRNVSDLERYNWDYLMADLAHQPAGPANRVRPLRAEVQLTEDSLHEVSKDARIKPGTKLGMGPGAPSFRVERRGNELLYSDGHNAPNFRVALGADDLKEFPLKDGDVKYLAFGHELRKVPDADGTSKRVYDMTVLQFDSTMTQIEKFFGGAIWPKTASENSMGSGIVDLYHVYPMGRVVNERGITISAGISDAHTELFQIDPHKIPTLLKELASKERQASGQVYTPTKPKLR